MPIGKTLCLSHASPDAPNDITNGYVREFIKNGAAFLDCNEIYLKRGYSGSQKFIKDFISENGIEILIFAPDPTSFDFPLEFLKELRPAVFTVLMAGDTVYYFEPRDKYYAGAMDLLVVYDSFAEVEAFRELGGDALMFLSSFDQTRYFRSASREKTIDVSFVGLITGRKDRAEYLDYLAKNGVNVRVLGCGATGGRVSQEQMVEIFNRSRINLNFTAASSIIHLAGSIPASAARKQLKGRIAEVTLCGSFLLTEYVPGIEKVLLPGEETDIFSTKEELLEKIKFYLSNERAREAIAEGGYRRALKDYADNVAIPRLLAEIEARRQKKRSGWPGIPADAAFNKNLASYRLLYMIKFIKRFNFGFALEEFLVILKLRTIDLSQLYTFFIQEVVDKFPRAKAFMKNLIFKRND